MKKTTLKHRLDRPSRHQTGVLAWCVVALLGMDKASAQEDLTGVPFDILVRQEVVTASRLARQVSDAPSAVSIVTAEDIRTFGYRSLADVINSMSGLFTTNDRKYQYMGGRAFGRPNDFAGRVMLMIDGHPTQDNVFSQGYIGNAGLVDMALIERVEYVPGTGSVTYGNNAMLGIINVVTKKGADFGGAQVATELGSFGDNRERLTLGKQFENGADLLLSASVQGSVGQNLNFSDYGPARGTDGDEGQWARGRDGEQSQRFFAKYTYQGWTLEAAYANRNKDVPTAPRGALQLNDPNTARDKNAYLTATYETDLGLYLKSSTRFYFGQYKNADFMKFWDTTDPRLYRQNASEGEWAGVDHKFVVDWFKGHTIVFGLEYRDDQRMNFVRTYLDANQTLLPDETVAYRMGRQTTSLYVQDAIWLNHQWQIVVGLRNDSTSDNYALTSPRLAAIYSPSQRDTFKASYSEAFRLPNAYDKYYANGDYQAVPEQVRATELVWVRQFSPMSRLSTTLYHYELSSVVYSGVNGYLNNGHVTSNGLEVEAERRWADGLAVKSSLAFQRARDEFGQQLAASPVVMAKSNIALPVPSTDLRTGIEVQYIGPRQTMTTHTWLGGVPLLNLTLSNEHKWYGVRWSATIRNVFDRRYRDVAYLQTDSTQPIRETLQMDGTTFWLNASYDF